jgi:selenide, water dikinase
MADDAAVYQLNDKQAIVATTDFFPPIVDDPYDFGAISAANALSDIYAMGGDVLFAINLVAFPDNLDKEILKEILKGGAEKVAEAGGVVVGGHSVNDHEPKYGLAVIGLIDPQLVKRKGGAKPGDILVLTKPLGVGVITTALKQETASAEHVATATVSMKKLNLVAARAGLAAQAHAMTDITGYGLLGHAQEMVRQSSVNLRFKLSALPWLPGTLAYAEAGAFPGGMGNNSRHFSPWVQFHEAISFLFRDLLFTPETSGGLLVSLDLDNLDKFLAIHSDATIVGDVLSGDGYILVEP